MKENYYVYNNEAMASCMVLSILDKVKSIKISRSCLFLPILLDDRVVSYLLRKDILNLESFIKDEPRLFLNFNKRYNSLLPVLINSLTLLERCGYIFISDDNICIKADINLSRIEGRRFEKVESAIPRLLILLDKYSTEKLYSVLKVRL
ncbi:DUF6521 family protein [Acinetobacter sp. I-MWF]|uniref:three component ABC system middle component n=1 Tax=Acinetobacter sp. I-MWF TaxID=2940517 RepID=UPI0021CA835D|nr:three component ABC system middle component [Acinetobacter sp. I-MWF]MCT9980293.1 DUF6521 family protein [Acinetobacter sp. I-MWF]